METSREQYLRMAKEAREHASIIHGQLHEDYLFVAAIWAAMARNELSKPLTVTPAKRPA
ncbi:MAG: hypothetical protein ABSD74_11885 [Rhizomicrobium sp.]|jgi:hypothetical protein